MHPKEYAMMTGSTESIKHWKFPEGKFLKNYLTHPSIVNALAINDDNVLVSGGDNGSVYFWDYRTGYNFQKFQTIPQPVKKKKTNKQKESVGVGWFDWFDWFDWID